MKEPILILAEEVVAAKGGQVPPELVVAKVAPVHDGSLVEAAIVAQGKYLVNDLDGGPTGSPVARWP